jgi:metal-dependent amidase/aminoacylase/carboxypeptidase family protein
MDLAHRKVDRALKAGALALGAAVEITTLPGYLPLSHDPNLVALFRTNAVDLVGAANVRERGYGGGSTDMGDLSHILPTVQPYAGGATGAAHGADFRIEDHTRAVINPAKALAMTVVDLLANEAREARRVMGEFKPRMARAEYLAYLRGLNAKTLFRAEDLDR